LGSPIVLSDDDARRNVTGYRARRNKVAGMWSHLQYAVIPAMTRPDTDFMLGCVRVMFEKIVLPNGMALHYHGLHKDPATGDWLFSYGGRLKKLYGGKLLENIIQALAYIVVMDAALILREPMARIDGHLVLQSHDELGYLVPEYYAGYACDLLRWAMMLRPSSMKAAPIDTEVGRPADNYAEAK
jgi:hypothetical protein